MSKSSKINSIFRELCYDRLAHWCDNWYIDHWKSDQPFNTIVSLINSRLDSNAEFWQTAKILNAATGTGNTYVAFAKAGFNIFGTDGSGPMLTKAKENCDSVGIPISNLITEPLNWLDISGYLDYFKEESFDLIVLASNSFCHIPP